MLGKEGWSKGEEPQQTSRHGVGSPAKQRPAICAQAPQFTERSKHMLARSRLLFPDPDLIFFSRPRVEREASRFVDAEKEVYQTEGSDPSIRCENNPLPFVKQTKASRVLRVRRSSTSCTVLGCMR